MIDSTKQNHQQDRANILIKSDSGPQKENQPQNDDFLSLADIEACKTNGDMSNHHKQIRDQQHSHHHHHQQQQHNIEGLESESESESECRYANSGLFKRIVNQLVQRKKEPKLDNLETMINENALKLLQQKELMFKQSSSLQLNQLCKQTKFSRRELKWLYTGWKVACTDGCGVSTDSIEGPETSYGLHSLSSAYYGIINEGQFQQIYAQFFPYGGDCSFYAKYVFQAMFGDTLLKNGGFITFSDYANALSNLLRGTIEDKISFVFRLYDLNGDNVLTVDELSRIFFAVYRLLGDNVNRKHDQITYEEQAERFHKRMDLEQTGYVTKEQFTNYCLRDSAIVDTIKMLEISICSNS